MKNPIFTILFLISFHFEMNAQESPVCTTPFYNPGIRQKTYCNPLNIDYNYEFLNNNSRNDPFRSTADPVILTYKGEYYLFSTNQSGFYWSEDLGKWNFVFSGFQRKPDQDDQCAPAALAVGDTLYYMGSTYESLPVWYTTDPKSGRWMHKVDSTRLPAWDPALFLDDDGRLYLYYGSSGTLPVKGVEIDRNTFLPLGDQNQYEELYRANDILDKQKAIGAIRELAGLKPEIHGWERFGMNNDDPEAPWGHFIEGAWMNKFNGKYYLQYGAPGTEFKVYADGVWISDHPLGPFAYQKHNPFAYKPGGFVMGTGHGNTFRDLYGNYWHTGTCMISQKYKFERRIGLYPAGFDEDGILYTITSFGDYPAFLPDGPCDHKNGKFTGWMLLNYRSNGWASSNDTLHPAAYAFDEDIRTYWSANSSGNGEFLVSDLGKSMNVYAFQINYADHNATQFGKAMDLYHQYRVYYSSDGANWELLVDKSCNDRDIPHDYVELTKPVECRFLKLENIHMASGKFAVSGFRVFGLDRSENPPLKVKKLEVNRSATDPRNAMLNWESADNAYGYNIFFGIDPTKLYSCITVNGELQYDFRGLDAGTIYYFSIRALSKGGVSENSEIIRVE